MGSTFYYYGAHQGHQVFYQIESACVAALFRAATNDKMSST
jgi:hypothetical protein